MRPIPNLVISAPYNERSSETSCIQQRMVMTGLCAILVAGELSDWKNAPTILPIGKGENSEMVKT